MNKLKTAIERVSVKAQASDLLAVGHLLESF